MGTVNPCKNGRRNDGDDDRYVSFIICVVPTLASVQHYKF